MSIEAVLGLSRSAGFCKSPRLLIGVMRQGFAGLSFDPTEPSKMKCSSLRLPASGEPTVTSSVDGKINLVVRYGSKPLEFAKGKNAIELASEAEVADTLRKVRDAVELGELDTLIEQQACFGRRVTQKNK